MSNIAITPQTPYFAVIFTSQLGQDDGGYEEMATRMVALASKQLGFLGIESAREGLGITVSYWSNLESIHKWKANLDHQEAQAIGRKKWYASYKVRIAKVERDYGL